MAGTKIIFLLTARVRDFRTLSFRTLFATGVLLFTFSFSVLSQSSLAVNANTYSKDDEHQLLEALEEFYSANFYTPKHFENLKSSWKGDPLEYEAVRQKLMSKQLRLQSEFGEFCIKQHGILPHQKDSFVIALNKNLNDLLEYYYQNPTKTENLHIAEIPTSPTPPVPAGCENIDFSKTNFDNWQIFEGDVDPKTGSPFTYINNAVSGTFGATFNSGLEHNIITVAGLDPSGVPIQMIRPGRSASALIGDGTGTGGRAAKLRKSITVTPANYNFFYSYAVVLQNPASNPHVPNEMPYFTIRMYDQNNDLIPCATFSVFAGNGDADWRVLGVNEINYMDWQSAFIPLQGYLGQTVSIEFTVGDCTKGGHYAYAYIDASCDQPIQLSDTATCKGHPVTLTAPDGAKNYLWSNGATTRAITTTTPGTYYLRMEGTAGGGCYAYDTVNISLYKMPKADFSTNLVCLGNPTQFNYQAVSADPVATYKWDFLNNGTTNSTIQSPSYTYATSGNFSAKFEITTNKGCVHDTIIPVTVAPKATADFTSSLVCTKDSTVFTNTSTGSISNYKWDFYNDNTKTSTLINPKFLYTNQNGVTAKLKVTSSLGCSDSITHPVLFNPLPIAGFTQTNVCFPSAMAFNNTSSVSAGTIAQNAWNFGVANATSTIQHPSYLYSQFGTYNVKLKVTSDKGCLDSITKTVKILEKPTINFTAPNVCDKLNVTLTNTSTITTPTTFTGWQWDIMNDGSNEYTTQNASHLFPSAGTFRILLKGTTNETCWDTVSKSVIVYPLPKAEFNSKNACKGKANIFTDKSTGTINSWKWDVDNNGSIDLSTQNPTYTYAAAGAYTAKLKVTSDKGCVDSITHPTKVNPLPVAGFTSTNICSPSPMLFVNSSTVSPGNINYIKWTFQGNNDTSNINSPSKIFTNPGNYNIKLFVRSDSGCVDSITKPVIYFEKPVANFTYADLCAQSKATLTNSSTVATSTIQSYKWDINGDYTTEYTSNNVSHKYNTAGTNVINLIVTTAQGCIDTAQKTITVNPLPVADFTSPNVCMSDSSSFTANCSINGGSIVSYDWRFNNGTSVTQQNPKRKFGTHGNQLAKLIVTSDKNCKDTADKTIVTWPLPLPDFSSNEVCLSASTTFENLSSIPTSGSNPNTIQSLDWNFGDGNSYNGTVPVHTFNAPGTYTMKLKAISANQCIDSIIKNIVINPNPQPNFTSSTPEGCATWCVDFTNATTISSGSISSYTWNFDDGGTSTATNPKHCFANTGSTPLNFDISLHAVSDKGCVHDTTIKNMITADPITHADFSFSPTELDENNTNVDFLNESRNENQWTWRFGDNNTSTAENPKNKYAVSGDYNITLIVNNQYNCIDSITKPLKIKPVWSYYIPNAFSPNGDGTNDIFYVYGYNIIDFKLYIFNRWGEQIFASYDINHGWNGELDGRQVQIDTYVYKAYLTDVFGEKHSEVGIVTIVR